MILYEYRCWDCGQITEALREIKNRNDSPKCSYCGKGTRKIISRYYAVGDLEPYYDDNLQTHIESKRHRRKVMRDQGVAEKFGKGWH